MIILHQFVHPQAATDMESPRMIRKLQRSSGRNWSMEQMAGICWVDARRSIAEPSARGVQRSARSTRSRTWLRFGLKIIRCHFGVLNTLSCLTFVRYVWAKPFQVLDVWRLGWIMWMMVMCSMYTCMTCESTDWNIARGEFGANWESSITVNFSGCLFESFKHHGGLISRFRATGRWRLAWQAWLKYIEIIVIQVCT